ncbi:hypothetical protein SERLA73DRAFT_187840, partial [Serpula lacrymans var. lacrymans S7.3]
MTLNIPFLFACVLVQHLFGMEEKFETSIVRHLRASLSTLPIRTKAKCHIQSEQLSLKSRCQRAQYSRYWYRREGSRQMALLWCRPYLQDIDLSYIEL